MYRQSKLFLNRTLFSQELKAQFDKDFYKTLALLKNRDPKIYNQDVTFFNETNKAQEVHGEKKKQKVKKEKAVFLRDYERNIIVERDGKYSDSEDETELRKNEEGAKQITYVQEQKQLKESFKNALQIKEAAEEEEGDFLKPKAKSESEKQKVSYFCIQFDKAKPFNFYFL